MLFRSHTVETGLKYVNNDACYPSILVTGQMIEALESGKYDVNKTALIMSQTGGGCRATNYIGFIRKALRDAGFSQVPVISFNVVGMERMPGFKITVPLMERLLKCVLLADLLQKVLEQDPCPGGPGHAGPGRLPEKDSPCRVSDPGGDGRGVLQADLSPQIGRAHV